MAVTANQPKAAVSGRLALVLTTALAPAAWGTTYIVTTELLPPDRPLLAGLVRALPAGLALAAVSRQRPIGGWWIKILVLGTLNIGGFFALLFVAAYRLPGGVAAILGAVQPLAAASLAALLLRERLRLYVIAAGLLGVVGVSLLVLRAEAQLDTLGVVAGLSGAASMAIGVVLTKHWGRPVKLLTFTAWQLIAGGAVLLPLVAAIEGWPTQITLVNMGGYLWLATAGTAFAYTLWFRGIEQLPVAQVTLLGLASSVVAAAAGWIVLKQALTPPQMAGATFVLAAIWLGQHTKPDIAAAQPQQPDSRPKHRPDPEREPPVHSLTTGTDKYAAPTEPLKSVAIMSPRLVASFIALPAACGADLDRVDLSGQSQCCRVPFRNLQRLPREHTVSPQDYPKRLVRFDLDRRPMVLVTNLE